jgi:hypothetical protein
MFGFIGGNIRYFLTMLIILACCVLCEGALGGKFLALGFVSCACGTPLIKHTKSGTKDKRCKDQPFIWWQILVGVVLIAIGGLLLQIKP